MRNVGAPAYCPGHGHHRAGGTWAGATAPRCSRRTRPPVHDAHRARRPRHAARRCACSADHRCSVSSRPAARASTSASAAGTAATPGSSRPRSATTPDQQLSEPVVGGTAATDGGVPPRGYLRGRHVAPVQLGFVVMVKVPVPRVVTLGANPNPPGHREHVLQPSDGRTRAGSAPAPSPDTADPRSPRAISGSAGSSGSPSTTLSAMATRCCCVSANRPHQSPHPSRNCCSSGSTSGTT
jgi:hypothetical protein